MGSSGRSLKSLFGVLSLLGFIWLLLIGILEAETNTTVTPSRPAGRNFKPKDELKGREKVGVHPESDLNYMSKRRVPNGPDPIHNRRAGNSRQPPGRA